MALLMYAQDGNYEGCLSELDRGVDPNIVNYNGWTSLHWVAYNDHRRCMHLLLERNANLHTRDIFGKTPLFWAIYNNREHCIQILLEKGLDILRTDTWTDTQIDLYEQYQSCIRLLKKKYEKFNCINYPNIMENPKIRDLIQEYMNICK